MKADPADIADMSIEQARGRFQTMHRAGFQADFFAFDCFGVSAAMYSANWS
jgi:mRNA (guanine-N7-)-methyltransferase